MHMYVCMYVYIYIYIERERDIHTSHTYRTFVLDVGLRPRALIGQSWLPLSEDITDGIGTPDPNPRNLVNRCF